MLDLDLDPDARILGLVLGLGDLNMRPPCHGYSCGCLCDECVEREHLAADPPRRPVSFPWEGDEAA